MDVQLTELEAQEKVVFTLKSRSPNLIASLNTQEFITAGKNWTRCQRDSQKFIAED
jgi:hypothetical protein